VSVEPGRLFREAWIDGVHQHYPGTPKPGYVTPWDDTPQWERDSAAAVEQQIVDFVTVSGGTTAKLTREQRGQFVALCWIAQIHHHIDDPKPAYVAPWDALPPWQQDTDAHIFDVIERHTLAPDRS
jgi:hypothetical protein